LDVLFILRRDFLQPLPVLFLLFLPPTDDEELEFTLPFVVAKRPILSCDESLELELFI